MTATLITGTCFTCKGWGTLPNGDLCHKCQGNGEITGQPCALCGGTGDGWTPVTSRGG